MVVLAVMVLWISKYGCAFEKRGIGYGWVYRKQVVWPTLTELEYQAKRMSLPSLRLAESKQSVLYNGVQEIYEGNNRYDGESRNIVTSISEYGYVENRDIGYGQVYLEQVVWPTLTELEYRVKRISLPSLSMAESTNQSVLYFGKQDHFEALTGCNEHYFSRDTDIARQKLSKCRIGVRREDKEYQFGIRQPGNVSQNRGGPGSFYFEQVVDFINMMMLEFLDSSNSFISEVVTKAVFSDYKVYKNNSGSFIQAVVIDYETGDSKAVYKLKELKDTGDKSLNKSQDSAHSKLSKGLSSCQCLVFEPVTFY